MPIWISELGALPPGLRPPPRIFSGKKKMAWLFCGPRRIGDLRQGLLDKLWEGHEILRRADGTSLLWVDRHLVHEGSHHAFAKLSAGQNA